MYKTGSYFFLCNYLSVFQHCSYMEFETAWFHAPFHHDQKNHCWNCFLQVRNDFFCRWGKFCFTFCMKYFLTWKLAPLWTFTWPSGSISFFALKALTHANRSEIKFVSTLQIQIQLIRMPVIMFDVRIRWYFLIKSLFDVRCWISIM